jgi:hypothetical protein
VVARVGSHPGAGGWFVVSYGQPLLAWAEVEAGCQVLTRALRAGVCWSGCRQGGGSAAPVGHCDHPSAGLCLLDTPDRAICGMHSELMGLPELLWALLVTTRCVQVAALAVSGWSCADSNRQLGRACGLCRMQTAL